MILMGDFNGEHNEANMQNFLNLYHLEDLVQEKTCFKNRKRTLDWPHSYKLLYKFLKLLNVLKHLWTILSDSHKMAVSVLKSIFQNANRALSCIVIIKVSITKSSGRILILSYQNVIYITKNANNFWMFFAEVLRKYSSMKIKYIRANQSGFMNKNLRRTIMRKSWLHNMFLKEKTEKSRKA